MILRRNFGIATLLAVVTASAVGIVAYDYFSAAGRYRRNGDVDTFCYLLATQIESGYTLAEVVSILGPGTRADESYRDAMRGIMFGSRFDSMSRWPDGIAEEDVFILYPAHPKPAYELQFRDGRLVNHDPAWYEGPDVMVTALQ